VTFDKDEITPFFVTTASLWFEVDTNNATPAKATAKATIETNLL
jgi:hypothetical protein